MEAQAVVASHGRNGLATALRVSVRGVPSNQVTSGLPLGLLQAGLISSEITLFTGSDPKNLDRRPINRSWRFQLAKFPDKFLTWFNTFNYVAVN